MKKMVLVFLLFGFIAKGKTNYDLNSAIATALENNHNVKIARYNLETAQKERPGPRTILRSSNTKPTNSRGLPA